MLVGSYLFGPRAYPYPLTGIAKRVGLLPMQGMRFSGIVYIGLCPRQRVDQSRACTGTDVPLITFLTQCISGSRSPPWFFFEGDAAIKVASTMVSSFKMRPDLAR